MDPNQQHNIGEIEKHKILENLGFKKIQYTSEIYSHDLIKQNNIFVLFDFSANSIEGITHEIFSKGIEIGKNKLREDFQNLMRITIK